MVGGIHGVGGVLASAKDGASSSDAQHGVNLELCKPWALRGHSPEAHEECCAMA